MRHRSPALGFIFVTLFLDVLGFGLIIPILPNLLKTFNQGDMTKTSLIYGSLAALYSLMQFAFAPVLGSLSDHFGRRPILLGSLFGSAVDYLFLAFAPTLPWFFVGRVINGVTGASITTAGAYIADISPPEKRAANFGIIGAAFGLGFIAGPALGGWLGQNNLRLPFIVAACLTFANWLYGFFILPESLKLEHRRPFSLAHANPFNTLAILRQHPVVLGLSATFLCLNLAHFCLQSTWVLYTGYRFNWGPRAVGISLAIVGVMAAVVQGGLVRMLIPRLGERRAIILGLSINVINFLLYGLATQGWMLYAVLTVGSIAGVAGPATQGLISRNVPPNQQGAIQGALTSIASLCGIIGPPVATGIFGYFISNRAPIHLPGAPFFLGSLLVFTGLILALRCFRKNIPIADPPPPATPASAIS